MKTDKITVTNAGQGMAEAVDQAAAAAAYRGLAGKEKVHLRLLAEEMLGMLRQIAGETEAVFWVESEEKRFQLHLVAHPIITGEMRRELLSVSSSGKNAAAVGVMGKLRDIIERAFYDAAGGAELSSYSAYYMQGLIFPTEPDAMDPMAFALNASLNAKIANWSMRKYKVTVEQEKSENADAQEEWDELEKSIVANIADEVTVAIRGGEVEMIVYKNFN